MFTFSNCCPYGIPSFNSINGFKITKWTAIKLIWYQITLIQGNKFLTQEVYSLKKPTPLNLMRQVGEMNFFSNVLSNSCGVLIGFLGQFEQHFKSNVWQQRPYLDFICNHRCKKTLSWLICITLTPKMSKPKF